MQFIEGHRGVPGNEATNSAAKAAHLLQYRTLTPYSKEETFLKPQINTTKKKKNPPFARKGDKALTEIHLLDQGHPSPHGRYNVLKES
ncbi:hypothetical protein FHG87_009021 [Trinorchestia longiramus]|nr:hypothetical protein FHG87_009021 [Trinorchestia longiramus]